jgi:hypothetical protein
VLIEHVSQLITGDLFGGADLTHSRVVDQDVHAAEPGGRMRHDRRRALGIAHVVCDRGEAVGVARREIVQPALVDTDLFTLPGNEPPLSDLSDALPPRDVAEAVLEVIDNGRFERYVPDWFAEMASGKAADVEGFIAGVKEWTRERLQVLGAEPA